LATTGIIVESIDVIASCVDDDDDDDDDDDENDMVELPVMMMLWLYCW
jgi:hypothetical protein